MADNNKGIKITEILSVIGLALFALGTYLGYSFLSGGKTGLDLLASIGMTVIVAICLIFIIKAKGAQNHLQKWKIIEYSVLVVLLIIMIGTGWELGIRHLAGVYINRQELQEISEADLAQIRQMTEDYETSVVNELAESTTMLKNAVSGAHAVDAQLKEFLVDNGLRTAEDVNAWNLKMERQLIGTDFAVEKNAVSEQADEISGVIKSWSLLNIPGKANEIGTLAATVNEKLSQFSERAEGKLPEIELTIAAGYDSVSNSQPPVYELKGYAMPQYEEELNLEFRDKLAENQKIDIATISLFAICMAIIIILTLLAYITAQRTSIHFTKELEQDNGISLR